MYVPSKPLLYSSYHHIEPKIKHFDLLYFTCDDITSNVGKVFQKSPFTHIGILFNINNTIYLWEADNHKSIDRYGVDLIPLEIVMKDYPTKHYALQPLIMDETYRNQAFIQFVSLMKKHRKKEFKFSIKTFIYANYKIQLKKHKSPINTSFFCSELVAYTYIYCGIMKQQYPYWAYTPGDFYHNNIKYIPDISLGKIIPFHSFHIN